ncbi:hypothetical protein BB560_003538, partial [Smittium megazygosporum]
MVKVRSPTQSTYKKNSFDFLDSPTHRHSLMTTERVKEYLSDSLNQPPPSFAKSPRLNIASIVSPSINNDLSLLYNSRLSIASIASTDRNPSPRPDTPSNRTPTASKSFSTLLMDIPDSPVVPGLEGRHKLVRNTSHLSENPLYKRNGKWCDIERRLLAAYEYLCHVHEAKEWIESLLSKQIAPISEFEESLRDGVTLAELAKVFCPQAVGRIITSSDQKQHSISASSRFLKNSFSVKRYMFVENINYFLKAISMIGLPPNFHFEVSDLYDAKNFPKVVYCIHATSKLLESIGFSKGVDNLVGVLEYSEEELEKARLRLENANNVSKLEFADLPRRLSSGHGQITKSESVHSNTTTPNSSSSTLPANSISDINATKEKTGIDFYSFWEQNSSLLIQLQAFIRRHLARNEYRDIIKAQYYKSLVDSTKLIQALVRSFLDRQNVSKLRLQVLEDKKIEAHRLLKAQLAEQAKRELEEAKILEAKRIEEESAEFNRRITNFQAHVRGFLARKLQSDIGLWVKSIKCIQALCRGALVRFEYTEKLHNWHNVQVQVSKIQALVRGYLVRKSNMRKIEHYKKNINVIVKIQNLFRAKLAGAAYKTLTFEDSVPTPITVRKCVPILDDTDQDLYEELEIERLRQLTVRKIRDNQHTEQLLKDLEIKIALLVRNKLSIDDIVKQTKVHLKFFKELRNPSIMNNTRIVSTYFSQSQHSGSLYNLNNLNRNSRQRLDSYQHLFYLLQTQPIYLARLLVHQIKIRVSANNLNDSVESTMPISDLQNRVSMLNIENSKSSDEMNESTVMALFGYAQNSREEYLLLKLFCTVMELEISSLNSLEEFNVSNSAYLISARPYINGVKNHTYLSDSLKGCISEVISHGSLDLESDPLIIYRSLIRNEELKTGTKSNKPFNISRDEALNDQETRKIFINNLRELRIVSGKFLDCILASLDSMPYGIRYLSSQLKSLLERKFPGLNETQYLRVIGHVLFYQYFASPISSPNKFGLYDGELTILQKKNLIEISKILGQIASGVQFENDNMFLQPLNNYVTFSSARFSEYLFSLVKVADLDAYFQINEFADLILMHRPTLYASIDDILKVHTSISNNIDLVAPDKSLLSKDIEAGNQALKAWLRKSARKSALRKYTSSYFSESDAALPIKSIASMGTFRNDFDKLIDSLPPGTVLVEKADSSNPNKVVMSFDDPLLVILRELGPPPRLRRDPYARTVLTLDLSDRFAEDSIAFMTNSVSPFNSNNINPNLSDSAGLDKSILNISNLVGIESEKASAIRTLYLKTKRNWLAILLVQSGNNLMEILKRPTTSADEERWRAVVEDELKKLEQRRKHFEHNWASQQHTKSMLQSNANMNGSLINPQTPPSKMGPIPGEDAINEWKNLSFAQLKTKVRIAMETLDRSKWVDRPRRSAIGQSVKESRKSLTNRRGSISDNEFRITASNNYQGMLNAIVRDLKTKSARREQRRIELRRIRHNFIALNKKTEYINSKQEYYERYLESCIEQQTKPKHKSKTKSISMSVSSNSNSTRGSIVSRLKARIPSIKSFFGGKDSSSINGSGTPKIRSFKYSAEKLYLKGVLFSIEGFSPRQLDKVSITISSPESGVFDLSIYSLSSLVQPSTCKIRLEDLLQMQYDNSTTIMLFNDSVKMN